MTYTEEVLRYGGLPPARPLAFGPLNNASALLVGGAGVWAGHATEETTGAASARLTVLDAAEAGGGQLLAPLTFGPNESRFDLLPGAGLVFTSGLFVTVTAGTVAGVLYVVLMDPDELAMLRTVGMTVEVTTPLA